MARKAAGDLVALEMELIGLKRELVTARRGLSSRDRVRRQRAIDEVANLSLAANKVEDRIIWLGARTRAATERAARSTRPTAASKPAQLRLFNPDRWSTYYDRHKGWKVYIGVPPRHTAEYAPRYVGTRASADDLAQRLNAELARRRSGLADPASKSSEKRLAKKAARRERKAAARRPVQLALFNPVRWLLGAS